MGFLLYFSLTISTELHCLFVCFAYLAVFVGIRRKTLENIPGCYDSNQL